MKRLFVLTSAGSLLGLALFLFGCASLSVTHDFDRATDFSRYRTFNWIERTDEQSGLLSKRIQSAVNAGLIAKGLHLDPAAPDLLLAYHFGVEDKVEVTDWGYTYPGRYGGWGGGGVDVRQYQEGTLILDLIDVGTKELVWRASATGVLEENPTADKIEKNVNTAVSKMLDKYPPK